MQRKSSCLSSTAFHENINDYVKEAITFMEAGWTAHKIHPHGIPDIDIKICPKNKKIRRF
ncbi:MAG: hypothetical protein Ct9H90mP2_10000 [Dehalococcoidia bacterium]|nr:MAG: hypothetical protein Ct9H90mP2_10000 [Dehalococcoidia bacterium]